MSSEEETGLEANTAVSDNPTQASSSSSSSSERFLRVGCFNLLCDGLSFNEFQCVRGDENYYTKWSIREPKLVHILSEMFTQGCGIVVTLENDHFHRILRQLRVDHSLPIRGIQGLNYNDRKPEKHSTAYNVRAKRMLKAANIPFTSSDDYYALCNTAFHEGRFSRDREDKESYDIAYSFAEECGDADIAKMVAEIYGKNIDDFYLSDDSIGVYYNEQMLELLEVSMPWEEHMNGIVIKHHRNAGDDEGASSSSSSDQQPTRHQDEENSIVVLNAAFCLKCLFRIKATNQCVTLYAAHLKSGEGVGEEMQRYHQLKIILKDTQSLFTDTFPVIAMDSNNSRLYEYEYPTRGTMVKVKSKKLAIEEDVVFEGCESDLMKEFHMKDGISLQTHGRNECFKMRNGITDQKAKAFKLMFDTIDKILIHEDMEIVHETDDAVKHYGFEPYDISQFEHFYAIRTDKEKRREFYDYCLTQVSSACCEKAFGPDSPWCQLYPNAHAPSDHPPISLGFYY